MSARWRIWAMIQSPHCCAPGVPGCAGPNCELGPGRTPCAACASNGVCGVTALRWHPASDMTTQRSAGNFTRQGTRMWGRSAADWPRPCAVGTPNAPRHPRIAAREPFGLAFDSRRGGISDSEDTQQIRVAESTWGRCCFALTALTSLLLLNYIAKNIGNLVGKGLPWTRDRRVRRAVGAVHRRHDDADGRARRGALCVQPAGGRERDHGAQGQRRLALAAPHTRRSCGASASRWS